MAVGGRKTVRRVGPISRPALQEPLIEVKQKIVGTEMYKLYKNFFLRLEVRHTRRQTSISFISSLCKNVNLITRIRDVTFAIWQELIRIHDLKWFHSNKLGKKPDFRIFGSLICSLTNSSFPQVIRGGECHVWLRETRCDKKSRRFGNVNLGYEKFN